jgi:hypothetical protein
MSLIAKQVHSSESTHWYTRDGVPAYTVPSKKDGSPRNTTLRDARELSLIPSVTTILNIAAKPGLTVWLQEQAILAALTLPRDEDEPESVWLKRVVQDSKQQAKDAADKGTEIHEAIQSYYEGRKDSKYPFHVSACANIIKSRYGDVNWIAERSFGHELGFGGKCDMHTTDAGGIVVDIKTKEFTDVTKPLWYDEHLLQLAAYRVGLGIPTARCANVFVSRTDPELAVVKEWEEDDLQRGWEMFTHLLAYWQLKNQHE